MKRSLLSVAVLGGFALLLAGCFVDGPPVGRFVLSDAQVGGDAKLAPFFAKVFTAFEIAGERAGPLGSSGISLTADKEFPVSVLIGNQEGGGTGSFSMTAAVDQFGATHGTFAYLQTYGGTWDVTETRNGDTKILGKGEMKATWTWKGDVAGSVDVQTADLTFSGASITNCSYTLLSETRDCSSHDTWIVPVKFTVTGSAAAAPPPLDPTTSVRARKAHELSTSTNPEDKAALSSKERKAEREKEARKHYENALMDASDEEIDAAIKLDPTNPDFRFRKAALALARDDKDAQEQSLSIGAGLEEQALQGFGLGDEDSRREAAQERYLIALDQVRKRLGDTPEGRRVNEAYCRETAGPYSTRLPNLRERAYSDPIGKTLEHQWAEIRKGCP